MKPKAIVYTSNTGFTAQYAGLLGDQTGLPVYPLDRALKILPAGSPILYLGWLMAGKVQGYDKAAKRFVVTALCGVGMGATGSQDADVRKSNAVAEALPVFTLQGGYDGRKLRGVYRLMMGVMGKIVSSQLEKKPDRTPQEDDSLDLFRNGGSRVRPEHLDAILAWYQGEAQ